MKVKAKQSKIESARRRGRNNFTRQQRASKVVSLSYVHCPYVARVYRDVYKDKEHGYRLRLVRVVSNLEHYCRIVKQSNQEINVPLNSNRKFPLVDLLIHRPLFRMSFTRARCERIYRCTIIFVMSLFFNLIKAGLVLCNPTFNVNSV